MSILSMQSLFFISEMFFEPVQGFLRRSFFYVSIR
jgi:hypothetical protein